MTVFYLFIFFLFYFSKFVFYIQFVISIVLLRQYGNIILNMPSCILLDSTIYNKNVFAHTLRAIYRMIVNGLSHVRPDFHIAKLSIGQEVFVSVQPNSFRLRTRRQKILSCPFLSEG